MTHTTLTSIAPAFYADYLNSAPARTNIDSLRASELYTRTVAEYDRNWQKHLPHPLWGSVVTRRRFEILTIALQTLGYTLTYNVVSDDSMQLWHVTKGEIAGYLYHNAALDRFELIAIPVIPTLAKCATWV